MLTLTFSNKYQELLDCLLEETAKPPESPFAAVEIIIPSAAIQRNIELEMANRLGICANVQFSYLGMWAWSQVAKISPSNEKSPFSAQTLIWLIYRIFSDPSFVQAHPRLAVYLATGDARMRFDLAVQTAVQLEQTMTFRPDWIQAWSEERLVSLATSSDSAMQDQRWQAALMRRLMAETDDNQQPATALKLLEALDADRASILQNGSTVHIFCLPTIAPLYIDILNQLGRWIDLHLYVLNPCREYWFDIVDPRRLSYLAVSDKADHHEIGNPLLASWGKQTRAMADVLFEKTSLTCDENSRFRPNIQNDEPSLLAQVQDAILDLHDLLPGSVAFNDDDRSIEVHCCHSLTRELEVLQDQLLALFSAPNPPTPDEVLVVTPDLEHAAPLVEAVFGTVRNDRWIPYTITGLGNSRNNAVAVALLDLLTILPSRLAASDMFQLLQQPVIAQRFELNDEKLKMIHRWIAESGIRWGLDASHRARLGLPDSDRYTVKDGLQRLFAGYALPSGSGMPFGTCLPSGDIEGSDAATLGCFWHFTQALASSQLALSTPRPAEDWSTALLVLLDTFMAPKGNQLDDWREVQQQILELCNNMQNGGGDHPVPLEVLHAALISAFDNPARGGVPTGNVTFTSMSSLRHLPYRIVCVIGLNDGAFPSTRRPAEFDLIALEPRRGDRQRRDDERNLFLDLLLAAQDRLYLSYTGRSVRDNSPMPPSVLISDLLEYLGRAIDEDGDAQKRLLIKHPLQPFSLDYFQQESDHRIVSSNREYHDALQGKLRDPVKLAPPSELAEEDNDDTSNEATQRFFRQALPPPGDEWRQVSLDQLLQFFRNPSRYLLRHRLGVAFPETQDELPDNEPFLPQRDEQTSLADRLLPLYLKGSHPDLIRACAVAGTEYPPGAMGNALLDAELQALDDFVRRLKDDIDADCLPPQNYALDFSIDGETWHLTQVFGDLRTIGLIRYRFDDVRASDYLAGWLHHLFLNGIAPSSVQPQTVWHSRNGHYVLNPLNDARTHLQALLSLYRRGLCEPLHFYPRSAWEYVKGKNDLNKAVNRWRGGRNEAFGEGRDPAYRQALRGTPNPLDTEFETCARTIFEPMLKHITDPRLE